MKVVVFFFFSEMPRRMMWFCVSICTMGSHVTLFHVFLS